MHFRSSAIPVAALAGAALLFSSQVAHAQAKPTQENPDKPAMLGALVPTQAKPAEDKSKRPSPPAVVTATVKGTDVTIDYSRPLAKGRPIFGDKTLVPYGAVWRTGANEATTFTVTKAVKIEGQALPAGTYGLFTIPGPTEWTIIFNKTAKQWGAFKYDATQDALRVTVKPKALAQPVEQFTINADKSGNVALTWESTEVDFKVK